MFRREEQVKDRRAYRFPAFQFHRDIQGHFSTFDISSSKVLMLVKHQKVAPRDPSGSLVYEPHEPDEVVFRPAGSHSPVVHIFQMPRLFEWQ